MPIILTPYVQQKAASKDFVGKDFNYASSGYGIIESGSMVGKNVTYVVKGSSPEAAFGAMFARSQYNHPWVGSGANADQYMVFDGKATENAFTVQGAGVQ